LLKTVPLLKVVHYECVPLRVEVEREAQLAAVAGCQAVGAGGWLVVAIKGVDDGVLTSAECGCEGQGERKEKVTKS
jgi:hypothetical protein